MSSENDNVFPAEPAGEQKVNKEVIRKLLLKESFISPVDMIRYTQLLQPKELLEISAKRDKNLPLLPYCDEVRLAQFREEVDILLWEKNIDKNLWEKEGYGAVKRALSSREKEYYHHLDYYELPQYPIEPSLLRSNYWYLAFISYQEQVLNGQDPLNSVHKVMHQLKINKRSILLLLDLILESLIRLGLVLSTLLGFAGVFYINLALSYWLVTISLAYIPIYALPLISIIGFSPFLDLYLVFMSVKNKHIDLVILPLLALFSLACALSFIPLFVTSGLVTLLAIFFTDSLIFIEHLLIDKLASFIKSDWENIISILIFKATFSGLKASANLLIHAPLEIYNSCVSLLSRIWSESKLSADEKLLKTVEENIIRLQISDEPSAIQKGAILYDLWQKILKDANNNQKMSWAQKLSKKYCITNAQEEQFQLSFQDVAAISRQPQQNFNLKTDNSRVSFFGSNKTTSTQQLSQYLQSEVQQPAL